MQITINSLPTTPYLSQYMNILVIHGAHTIKSYNYLQEIIYKSKSKGWRIEKISKEEYLSLSEKLTATSLFEEKKLYLVDDVSKLEKTELDWLRKNAKSLDAYLVIYFRNTISNQILKTLPKGYKVKEFKLPKLIWQFLDSFYPKNTNNCLKLLHNVVKTEPEEFIFSLLAKQARDLYWVKLDPKSIPYPSWRVGKLKTQSAKFADGQLKGIIKELTKIDIRVKTSKDNFVDALDFLITTHLE